jgi:hypothetical protein
MIAHPGQSGAVDEFIRWLEGRVGRKLKTWERGKVMEYLRRIMPGASGLMSMGQNETSDQRRCDQCGRVGRRGFKSLGPTVVDWLGEPFTIPAITLCANSTACQKRWPKVPDYVLERMYA